MVGEGASKWKFIKTAILSRFWQNNTEKNAYENIFIPENPQILGCFFLNVLVLIRGFLLYTFTIYSIHNILLVLDRYPPNT